MRVCSTPGCPELFPASEGSRCANHRRQAERARRPQGNPYSTTGHRRFRNTVLTRDPICTACHQALSTVADHYPRTRRELEDAGLNPNDPTYGRGLCKSCHDTHTAHTTPGGWNAR